MKCVILTAPGEVVEGAMRAKELGYDVELYPTTRVLTELLDNRYFESALYLGKLPELSESKIMVRSLRASYIRMLRDARYENDDHIIYCESDFVPTIPAVELKEVVNRALSEHPDVDVLRPFHTCEWREGLSSDDVVLNDIGFSRMRKSSTRDLSSAEFWGTHALIVPVKSRDKVARTFAEYRLPTDIALSLANKKGTLKVYVCTHNLFYQIRRKCKSTYNYRVAGILLITEEQGCPSQIMSLIEQDYQNFRLFVFAKNIENLQTRFHNYIEKKHIILHCLHTYRSFISTAKKEFDIIALLGAGDEYTKDYISNIVRYHAHFPKEICSIHIGSNTMTDMMNKISSSHTVAGPFHSIKTLLNYDRLSLIFPLAPDIDMFDRTVFIDLFDRSNTDTQYDEDHHDKFLRQLYRLFILSILFIVNVKNRIIAKINKIFHYD